MYSLGLFLLGCSLMEHCPVVPGSASCRPEQVGCTNRRPPHFCPGNSRYSPVPHSDTSYSSINGQPRVDIQRRETRAGYLQDPKYRRPNIPRNTESFETTMLPTRHSHRGWEGTGTRKSHFTPIAAVNYLQWEILPFGPGHTIRRVQHGTTSQFGCGVLNGAT